jgi:hypothetical protein
LRGQYKEEIITHPSPYRKRVKQYFEGIRDYQHKWQYSTGAFFLMGQRRLVRVINIKNLKFEYAPVA